MAIKNLGGSRLELPRGAGDAALDAPVLAIPISHGHGRAALSLSERALDGNVLVLGGPGSGKGNLFRHILAGLASAMTQEDVTVVFDATCAYLDAFYQPGDVVLAHEASALPADCAVARWNLFEELLASPETLEGSARELADALFDRPDSAAGDAFFACLVACARRRMSGDGEADHRVMVECLSGQDGAALAEAARRVRGAFTVCFSEAGTLPMRRAIRAKGGKRIFILYDMVAGKAVAPIYCMLLDLAIGEALGWARGAGRVTFVLPLVRGLVHLEDAIHLGRVRGVRFVVGMSSLAQLRGAYGAEGAEDILTGLASRFSFRPNDGEIRDYIRHQLGRSRTVEAYYSQDITRGLAEAVVDGHVAEDWLLRRRRM